MEIEVQSCAPITRDLQIAISYFILSAYGTYKKYYKSKKYEILKETIYIELQLKN